jgi:hypothetical protein
MNFTEINHCFTTAISQLAEKEIEVVTEGVTFTEAKKAKKPVWKRVPSGSSYEYIKGKWAVSPMMGGRWMVYYGSKKMGHIDDVNLAKEYVDDQIKKGKV